MIIPVVCSRFKVSYIDTFCSFTDISLSISIQTGQYLAYYYFDFYVSITDNFKSMETRNNASNLATSLFKALDLLGLIATKEEGKPLGELVNQMNLPRSSVIRMLDSLVFYGLIERGDDKHYRVTEKFNTWRTQSPEDKLIESFKPLMERICAEVDEMVVIGRLHGRKIRHLFCVEPDRRVRVLPPIGRKFENYRLAMGKLVLGQRPDLIPDDIPQKHLLEIEEARKYGFAWNCGDAETDIVAWGTWLGEPSSMTPLIAVTWPTFRFSSEALERVKKILIEEELCFFRNAN